MKSAPRARAFIAEGLDGEPPDPGLWFDLGWSERQPTVLLLEFPLDELSGSHDKVRSARKMAFCALRNMHKFCNMCMCPSFACSSNGEEKDCYEQAAAVLSS